MSALSDVRCVAGWHVRLIRLLLYQLPTDYQCVVTNYTLYGVSPLLSGPVPAFQYTKVGITYEAYPVRSTEYGLCIFQNSALDGLSVNSRS